MSNPYLLPQYEIAEKKLNNIYYVLAFSGGRSSGFMLHHILRAHGGSLPDYVKVVFNNTGKEREETLAFVSQVSREWKVDITWTEYVRRDNAQGGVHDPKNHYRIVDFFTASRNGEPFRELVQAKRMLPNKVMRFCTSELKVETTRRWVARTVGVSNKKWKKYKSVLGMRYDDPKRWGKSLMEHCQTVMPMAEAGHTLQDVTAFWNDHPFDLGIPSEAGNCDLCFLKGYYKLVRLARADPKAVGWWVGMQDEVLKMPGRKSSNPITFSSRFSHSDLLNPKQLNFIDKIEVEDDEGLSCFCGD